MSLTFRQFYAQVFLAEHTRPMNIALHLAGTALSTAVLVTVGLGGSPWLLLAWPIAHAVPGLIGHRLFERDAAVGDVRLDRKDFPLWWFMVGNHVMTLAVLTGRYQPKATTTAPPETIGRDR